MTRLFNEEPTIAFSRSPSEHVEDIAAISSKIDLSGSVKLVDGLNLYDNRLLNAATELLGILATLPRQGVPRDVGLFRQHLLNAIESFRQRGSLLDYHPSVIEKSTFVLCSAFDEAILYTSWGDHARWENHSLLSKVFSQRNGGEAFFVFLEKALQQPGKLVDFIELQYVLLMLGFKGRYRNDESRILHEIKADTYAKIRHFRVEYRLPLLVPSPLSVGKTPKKILNLWKVLLFVVVVSMAGYAASEYWYYNARQPILHAADTLNIATENMSVPIESMMITKNGLSKNHSKITQTQTVNDNKKQNSSQWDIVAARLTDSNDAARLISELRREKYNVFSRATDDGIEVFIRAGDDLTEIRKIKRDLNTRFGLKATIRKEHK